MGENEIIPSSSLRLPTSKTPPHVAALAEKPDLAEEITAAEPDFIRELNQDGFTPSLSQCSDLRKMKDSGGRTPLHYAAIKGRVEIIKELLSHCPQALGEHTAQGETALNLAVMNSQFDAAKLLVEKVGQGDASSELITAGDDDVNKVLQLAMASSLLQILDFLKNRNIADNGKTEALSREAINRNILEASTVEALSDEARRIWSELQPMLLVAGSFMATVTYQAGLSPPQTIWKDNSKPTAAYYSFMISNTTGFFAAVLVMYLFRRPSYAFSLFCVALLSMVAAYVTLCIAMAPKAHGISMLVIFAVALLILFEFILSAKLGSKIRAVGDFLFKKSSSTDTSAMSA